MPIPAGDDEGFLQDGVYDCSLEEIRDRFGSFQITDRRQRLFEKLERYVQAVRGAGIAASIIVNGSFVTGTPDPNDVDLILELPADFDLGRELRPFEYLVQSRRIVRARFGLDLTVARSNSRSFDESVEFFQQVKGQPRRRKGILRVRL